MLQIFETAISCYKCCNGCNIHGKIDIAGVCLKMSNTSLVDGGKVMERSKTRPLPLFFIKISAKLPFGGGFYYVMGW